jgi:hypothetical protein
MEDKPVSRSRQRLAELGFRILHPSERIASDVEPLIRQFETMIGAQLPGDYHEFLREHGGAFLDDLYEAPITEPGHPGEYACPRGFFGFYQPNEQGVPHSLDLRTKYLQFKSRIRPGLVPIAHAIGGNLICLAVSGPSFGRVYYWDHETNHVWLVSHSFDDFLLSLQLTDDEDEGDDE